MAKKTIAINKMNSDLNLWMCDIDSWNDEVENSQVILDQNFYKIEEANEKNRFKQFQSQINYYKDELLVVVKDDIATQQFILNKKPEKSAELIPMQEELDIRVSAIEVQMKERKELIDNFIEEL